MGLAEFHNSLVYADRVGSRASAWAGAATSQVKAPGVG